MRRNGRGRFEVPRRKKAAAVADVAPIPVPTMVAQTMWSAPGARGWCT
jgi:hypothetical protein